MFRVYIAGSTNDSVKALEVANKFAREGLAVYCPFSIGWLKQDKEWLRCCNAMYYIGGVIGGGGQEVIWADEMEIPVLSSINGILELAISGEIKAKTNEERKDWSFDHVDDETIEYETGAKGTKLNTRFDLVPLEGLLAVAKVACYGADKYGEDNWKKGIPPKFMLNHALRHITLYLLGDTSEDHLPHAAWRLLAAIDCLKRNPELDKEKIPNEQ